MLIFFLLHIFLMRCLLLRPSLCSRQVDCSEVCGGAAAERDVCCSSCQTEKTVNLLDFAHLWTRDTCSPTGRTGQDNKSVAHGRIPALDHSESAPYRRPCWIRVGFFMVVCSLCLLLCYNWHSDRHKTHTHTGFSGDEWVISGAESEMSWLCRCSFCVCPVWCRSLVFLFDRLWRLWTFISSSVFSLQAGLLFCGWNDLRAVFFFLAVMLLCLFLCFYVAVNQVVSVSHSLHGHFVRFVFVRLNYVSEQK